MLSGLKFPWASLRNRLRGCPRWLVGVLQEKCRSVSRADFVERIPFGCAERVLFEGIGQ